MRRIRVTRRTATHTIPTRSADDQFGVSVALDGDTLVVRAPGAGAAYVHERNQSGDNAWGLVKKLTPAPLVAGDYFGNAVSISGDTIAVTSLYGD
jgi:hypothetical protein